ncbi:MAG: DNA mismatch endonuclease Vsr [Dysgonamonadaceae bacterium]|nr:DNA mismatch endonuclease Vsr [Dysgonamonadaceae bacterium]MDD3899851.1 DNA mismatch endonuclease Vsr [Dysgonamonadaceae bacterium]MDD4398549.1 DNA mismatch endonuclease Vsr [Dysgonamonadaceae bacterium]MEA5080896.1 DNA mismatch endonuclease Vsr [Dysgonamonadaceae bacterium]
MNKPLLLNIKNMYIYSLYLFMDNLTKEQRRKNMQAIKSSGSKIESRLAKTLFAKGYRYRKNDKTVYGHPDLTFKKWKIAIFVDGEFWHGKDWEIHKYDHKTNKEFWYNKIERNIERDREVNEKLIKEGWIVLRFWGNDINENILLCLTQIENCIKERKMNFKEKISIEEFGGKQLKNRDIVFTDNQEAIITHYLHNKKGNVSNHFKDETVKITKDILRVKYPEVEITNEFAENALQYDIFKYSDAIFPPVEAPTFKFIDLFAGIGGFRLAMQNLGGKCVFTSEWDKEAQRTYQFNFGEVPFGDITQEETKSYLREEFDILCAGFPCQAFSIAGKRGGFDDTRGTLFFDVAEIIKRKQPKAFFLENVKGLRNHDKGRTLNTILNVLRNDLNYFVPEPEIINAKDFGVPQNRERIYIVGFHKSTGVKDFKYPEPTGEKVAFSQVKEEKPVKTRYYLSTQYLDTLRKHKERHEKKGNGFGYAIISDDDIANAIVVGGMGRERNLVIDNRITDFTPETKIKGEVNREGIRRMTPREWARLQGFPDKYFFPVSDASAYKQLGNSVAVPAIQATAKEILKQLNIESIYRQVI